MSDVSYTLKATVRANASGAVIGKGDGQNVKTSIATRSVTARTANDTMKMIRLHSSARICGNSYVHWDDLASSGAPTLDIGVAPVDDSANAITADADALNDGLDVATAAGSARVIKDHANYGKQLWEFVSGLSADPNCLMDVYVSFVDAGTNDTGDVTIELVYFFD